MRREASTNVRKWADAVLERLPMGEDDKRVARQFAQIASYKTSDGFWEPLCRSMYELIRKADPGIPRGSEALLVRVAEALDGAEEMKSDFPRILDIDEHTLIVESPSTGRVYGVAFNRVGGQEEVGVTELDW